MNPRQPVGLVWLLALGVACGEAPIEPLPTSVSLGGVWDFTETLIVTSRLLVCRDTGSVTFTQTGSAFEGTGGQVGVCTGLRSSFSNAGALTIADGEVTDSSISFTVVGGCGCRGGECVDARYIGTITSTDPPRIFGESGCSVNLDGTWEAVPATPVATVELKPDSASMVVGERAALELQMWNAADARVFERPVEWSSSNSSLVAIGDSGDATAVGPGTVTVRASVNGLSDEIRIATEFVSFSSVTAGFFHTCGVATGGSPYCWGSNEFGQAGPSPPLAPCLGLACRLAPSAVSRTLSLRSVSPRFQTTCGLSADGTAHCWGANGSGQLGSGDSASASSQPVTVTGGVSFASLSLGASHACGVDVADAVYCWGSNVVGQLGTGSLTGTNVPLPVVGGIRFRSVSGGGAHTCGVAVGDTLYCWGDNFFFQMGVDTLSAYQVSAPTAAAGGLTFASVSAGGFHTCGIATDGQAYCWGDNRDSQLGVDSMLFSATPRPVSGSLALVALSSGAFHTCGLTVGGNAYCWGRGVSGQLGSGSTDETATPSLVLGGLDFETISAGSTHTCGLTTAGTAWCWGNNNNGELGDGTVAASAVPVRVVGQP